MSSSVFFTQVDIQQKPDDGFEFSGVSVENTTAADRLRAVDASLIRAKEEYQKRLQDIEFAQQQYKNRQSDLLQKLSNMAPIIKERDSRRQRALQKVAVDSKAVLSLREQLAQCENQYERRCKDRERIQNRNLRYKKYAMFLQNVVDVDSTFSTVDDVCMVCDPAFLSLIRGSVKFR